ncbi:inositol 2-dehydrogenase [Alkalihalophilus lindianensis]|uniref:Inositol 2-dehydrogenase n=1 Tax=Alkalihalophilus lindianensis TaxID=1630542 RepID=A0ABU3X528_9BACI|nr:inositol 2-dehydrogenase [Alkalihalophilus lindianensis]MDV2682888.1 inositol 2-dehydrogenase [Alkalihalophilus lindianensis]
MSKITVGIIGAGRIGQLHADNILRSDLLEVKYLADVSINHLKGTHYEDNIPVITEDPENIFRDPTIQAVFICSSTDTHAEFIKKAARAGKHIFCEKPVSFNVEETKEALEVVKISNVRLQVGFNRRFDKHFKKVREVVMEGKVGQPQLIKVSSRDPQAPPEEYVMRSGGMFMDMTIHDFDMVRYLSGSEVLDVTVKAANLVDPMFGRHGDVDTAIITLTFENGAIAVIDNSRQAVYGYDQRIEVFGDKGTVAAENEAQTNVQISTKDCVYLDNPKHFFLDRYKEAYIIEIEEFAKAISEGKEVVCTGEDGYRAELLALAASISWKEKRSVLMAELLTVEV